MRALEVKVLLDNIELPSWYREVEWHIEEVVLLWPEVDTPVARFRIEYMEPDVDTGVPERQYARWWYVERNMKPDAVIKTAWLALVVSDEHRRREAFTVNGKHIFEPHKPLDLGGANVRIQSAPYQQGQSKDCR